MTTTNLLLKTDSYKVSMPAQYPPGMDGYFGYIESRGGLFDKTIFFGLQAFLTTLTKPFTRADIEEAADFMARHGEPFNREGWEYILEAHRGYMPVIIKALPEGTLVPVHNALVTIETTDPKCAWVGTHLETALLRAVWYPTTVATISFNIKQLIKGYLEETADSLDGLPFKLHDFGARGVSSGEAAAIGGAAHLVNFVGSDTVEGIWLANTAYGVRSGNSMAGYSIPAAEHSTITSWGRENEVEAYRNMLRKFAKPGSLVAVVSDSYDIFNACEKLWGEQLRQEVIDSGATVVIRPDSGDPTAVVTKCLKILADKFGTTTNAKGYKLLKHVRLIQGDGIDYDAIKHICYSAKLNGFSVDNLAFGMGGALLQKLDRDTQKFALKCSAISVNGHWQDVYKEPATDTGKRSKRGRLSVINDGGTLKTISELQGNAQHDILRPVFINGQCVNQMTFDEVRRNANRGLA